MNNSPTLQRVVLAEVKVSHRLRPVSAAGVQSILASVQEIGQIKDPIHLRKKKDGLHLLAGGHRLEAYGQLGVLEADAWVWSNITDDRARLIEIDDNLAGAEMCPLDTAVFLAERKRIYEKLHPETKRGVAGALARHHATDTMSVASFVAATAEKFGLSERHIYRMVAAGEKLGVDASRLRHAPRQVSLNDLMQIGKVGEPTERYAIVDGLCSGTVKSASEARKAWKAKQSGVKPAIKAPVEDQFNALSKAWDRASIAAKKKFLLIYARDIWKAQNAGVALVNWANAVEPEGEE